MLRRPQRSLCLGSQEGSPEDKGGVGKSRKLAGGVCQRPPSGCPKAVWQSVSVRMWTRECGRRRMSFRAFWMCLLERRIQNPWDAPSCASARQSCGAKSGKRHGPENTIERLCGLAWKNRRSAKLDFASFVIVCSWKTLGAHNYKMGCIWTEKGLLTFI